MPDRQAAEDLSKLTQLTAWIQEIVKSKLPPEQKANRIETVIKGTTTTPFSLTGSLYRLFRIPPARPSAGSEESENHDDLHLG